MRWSSPKHLDTRIRSGFLFTPKRIGKETRWLEHATWLETFHEYGSTSGSDWVPTAWCAAPESAEGEREGLCMECGKEHPVWFADNELWNEVVRRPDGSDRWPFLCPTCFTVKSVEAGVDPIFRLTAAVPENPDNKGVSLMDSSEGPLRPQDMSPTEVCDYLLVLAIRAATGETMTQNDHQVLMLAAYYVSQDEET